MVMVNILINALKSISVFFEKMFLWETQSDLVPTTNFTFNKRIPTLKRGKKKLPLERNELAAKTYV